MLQRVCFRLFNTQFVCANLWRIYEKIKDEEKKNVRFESNKCLSLFFRCYDHRRILSYLSMYALIPTENIRNKNYAKFIQQSFHSHRIASHRIASSSIHSVQRSKRREKKKVEAKSSDELKALRQHNFIEFIRKPHNM